MTQTLISMTRPKTHSFSPTKRLDYRNPKSGPFTTRPILPSGRTQESCGSSQGLRRPRPPTNCQTYEYSFDVRETKYDGGTWHVEGQLNEHICATALYYYDSTNISASYLAFRQQSDARNAKDVVYEQWQHDWLEEIFGCRKETSAVQEVGIIDIKEGWLLTWPNIPQHKVQPFHLADPTKPGHHKILALFLVDPNIRITNGEYPCQRKDWWIEAIRQRGALSTLPAE